MIIHSCRLWSRTSVIWSSEIVISGVQLMCAGPNCQAGADACAGCLMYHSRRGSSGCSTTARWYGYYRSMRTFARGLYRRSRALAFYVQPRDLHTFMQVACIWYAKHVPIRAVFCVKSCCPWSRFMNGSVAATRHAAAADRASFAWARLLAKVLWYWSWSLNKTHTN